METHPIRLDLDGDLRRSRLTVGFRLLLALPHLVWWGLWGWAAQVVAIIGWFAILLRGSLPGWAHDFLTSYVRYSAHVMAYLTLAGNPYPGFTGSRSSYPVDIEIPPPQRQSRWKTLIRLPLAIPAFLLAGVLGTFGLWTTSALGLAVVTGLGVAWTCAFLGWFVALALGRMPGGLRDFAAYGVGYSAQVNAYLSLLTDRYPTSDPERIGPEWILPEHPVGLVLDDSERRSRVTVLFRFLLVLPHFVWLYLWLVPALLALIAAWLCALVTGRVPSRMHRFLAAFVRYSVHVYAFLFLVANPFPGFTGRPNVYPVEVAIPRPERQSRWVTGFRLLLAIPALILAGALGFALYLVGFLGWFAALATGRMPTGLRNLGAVSLRYQGQTWAYLSLLTSRYPYASPATGREQAGVREPLDQPQLVLGADAAP